MPSQRSTSFQAMKSTTSTSGDPVETLLLSPDGTGEKVVIGSDIERGMVPQVVIPKNVWQGSRLAPGGTCALLGTTMSPGFMSEDYVAGGRALLIASYPKYEKDIISLTRS